MSPERRNILIVDDIEINRAILFELFHEQYNVLEAENGKIALDLIAEYSSSIAVVLLDIVMPVMDGFDVLKQMVVDGAIDKTPVIMITAESDEEMALKGYSMGVVDIINKPFNPDIVRRRVQNTVDLFMHKFYLEDMVERQMEALEMQNEKLKMSNSFVIDALSTAVEFRNQESGQHIKRIHALAKLLLENLINKSDKYVMDAETIETIANASAMHDIGKIAIADAILLKPGRLSAEEFEIMKTHTVKGCEILQSINFSGDPEYYKFCYNICRSHHERWDGKGYPDGLAGDDIPLCAQVVSIADVYDALTSERVYKPAFTHEKAISMISAGECGTFNPDLMDCFIETAPDFLNGEKIHNYSVPSFESSKHTPSTDDELVAARILEQLRYEKSKFLTLIDLSSDNIFEYDVPSDTIRFSPGITELFPLEPEVKGFRHTMLNSDIVNQEQKPVLLSEIMKLNPQISKCVFPLELKTRAGDFETYTVTISAVFDNKNSAEKVSYVGKIASPEY